MKILGVERKFVVVHGDQAMDPGLSVDGLSVDVDDSARAALYYDDMFTAPRADMDDRSLPRIGRTGGDVAKLIPCCPVDLGQIGVLLTAVDSLGPGVERDTHGHARAFDQ
ncbi:hypothetical protein ABH922_002573 [Rhodococcus sp. 27YEA15]